MKDLAINSAFTKDATTVTVGQITGAASTTHVAFTFGQVEGFENAILVLNHADAVDFHAALSATLEAVQLGVPTHGKTLLEIRRRLGHVIKQDEIRRWLQNEHKHLSGQSPLDIIRSGRPQIILDLVDDMLTGQPL